MSEKISLRIPKTSSMPADEANGQTRRGLALLFPGQGSQRAKMGKHIAEISPSARKIFAQADEVLESPVSQLCLEGSDQELEDTINAQPAILTTSMAYLAYLRERLEEMGRRIRPTVIAGHSLGQYTAAVAAGAIDFSDGLRLVRERGRIMAEWARSRPGGLAAVLGMSDQDVRKVCRDASPEGAVGLAVLNGPGQTVISGDTSALERAMALARERGGRVARLPISVPSHTPLMRDAARELSRFIQALPFRDPATPLASNISGKLLTTAEEVREELGDQICAAVEWARCVVAMAGEGVGTFVELGPGQVLSRMVRRIRADDRVFSTDDPSPDVLLDLAAIVPTAGSADEDASLPLLAGQSRSRPLRGDGA